MAIFLLEPRLEALRLLATKRRLEGLHAMNRHNVQTRDRIHFEFDGPPIAGYAGSAARVERWIGLVVWSGLLGVLVWFSN